MEYGILSVIPPLIAFGLVIWKKELIPALLLGIFRGKVRKPLTTKKRFIHLPMSWTFQYLLIHGAAS